MKKEDMDMVTLGYTYASLLTEISMLYKEKRAFEEEFIRRKKLSIEYQDKNKMEVN